MWVQHDGGRQAAGFKGRTGDCVVRPIAIVGELPYPEVYEALHRAARAGAILGSGGHARGHEQLTLEVS